MATFYRRVIIILLALLIGAVPVLAQDDGGGWVHEADDTVYASAMSDDGARIYIGARDDTITAYTKDGEFLWTLDVGDSVNALATTSDGALVAAAVADKTMRLMSGDGEELWTEPPDTRRGFDDVAISTDGEYIAGISEDGKNAVLFSQDGQTIWDLDLRVKLYGVAIYGTGDAMRVIVGTADSRIIAFDVSGEETRERMVLDSPPQGIAISRAGDKIAVAMRDARFMLIDWQEQSIIWEYDATIAESNEQGEAVGMSADGSLVVGGTNGGNIYYFDAEGEVTRQESRDERIETITISADGTTIAIGARDDKAVVENVAASAEAYAAAQQTQQTILIGVVVVIVAAAAGFTGFITLTERGRVWWEVQAAPVRRTLEQMWRNRTSYLFLIPIFALLLVFNYYPALSGLYHAFTRWKPGVETTWVGLKNFEDAVLNNDYFWVGIRNAVIFVITGILKLAVPMLVAELIFNLRSSRLQYWMRTIFILPMVVPGVVGILLWQNLYDPQIGLLNNLLWSLGIMDPAHQIVWLGDKNLALPSIIFMGFPWVGALPLLMFYGSLINIPDELFDAAKVDGANIWKRFWNLDFPFLLNPLKTLLILTFIGSVQQFGSVFLTTGGGPGSSTYTPALELYYQATTFNRLGRASAIGIVLFIIILGGTIFNLRTVRSATADVQ